MLKIYTRVSVSGQTIHYCSTEYQTSFFTRRFHVSHRIIGAILHLKAIIASFIGDQMQIFSEKLYCSLQQQ